MYPPESYEDLQQVANRALFAHTGLSPIERDARKNTLGCLSFVAVIIALVAFWFLGNQINQQVRFSREGRTTTGEIYSVVHGRQTNSVVYRFEVDGKKYVGSDSAGHIKMPGDPIPIEYLASDPTVSHGVGYTGYYVVYLVCALFLFLSALQIIGSIRQIHALSQPETIVPLGPVEEDAPTWATQPYQNAMQEKRPPAERASGIATVMEEPLKPLMIDDNNC